MTSNRLAGIVLVVMALLGFVVLVYLPLREASMANGNLSMGPVGWLLALVCLAVALCGLWLFLRRN